MVKRQQGGAAGRCHVARCFVAHRDAHVHWQGHCGGREVHVDAAWQVSTAVKAQGSALRNHRCSHAGLRGNHAGELRSGWRWCRRRRWARCWRWGWGWGSAATAAATAARLGSRRGRGYPSGCGRLVGPFGVAVGVDGAQLVGVGRSSRHLAVPVCCSRDARVGSDEGIALAGLLAFQLVYG